MQQPRLNPPTRRIPLRAAAVFVLPLLLTLTACTTDPPPAPPTTTDNAQPFGIPVLAIENNTVTLYGDHDLPPGTTLQLIQAELFDGELFEAPIGTVTITDTQLDSGLTTGQLTLTGGSLVPNALRFCIPNTPAP